MAYFYFIFHPYIPHNHHLRCLLWSLYYADFSQNAIIKTWPRLFSSDGLREANGSYEEGGR